MLQGLGSAGWDDEKKDAKVGATGETSKPREEGAVSGREKSEQFDSGADGAGWRPLTNDEITAIIGVLRPCVRVAKALEKRNTQIVTTAMAEDVLFRLYPGWKVAIDKDPLDFSISFARKSLQHLLIDEYRDRTAKKREGEMTRVRETKDREEGELPIEDAQQWREMSAEDKAMMREILDLILERGGQRVERVYIMKLFFMIRPAEIAERLDISTATVQRDWDEALAIAKSYIDD